MIAVELRGVHMIGYAYLYMVHVVLLRVCTRFTTCRNYVIYVLLINHKPTHNEPYCVPHL